MDFVTAMVFFEEDFVTILSWVFCCCAMGP